MQTFTFFLSSRGFSEPLPEKAHVGITQFQSMDSFLFFCLQSTLTPQIVLNLLWHHLLKWDGRQRGLKYFLSLCVYLWLPFEQEQLFDDWSAHKQLRVFHCDIMHWDCGTWAETGGGMIVRCSSGGFITVWDVAHTLGQFHDTVQERRRYFKSHELHIGRGCDRSWHKSGRWCRLLSCRRSSELDDVISRFIFKVLQMNRFAKSKHKRMNSVTLLSKNQLVSFLIGELLNWGLLQLIFDSKCSNP